MIYPEDTVKQRYINDGYAGSTLGAGQAMNQAYNTSDYGIAAAAPQQPPLDRLLSAIAALEQATDLTLQTTDALCGAPPVGESKSTDQPSPSGMFAVISLSATRVERLANTIADCMNRIHRVAG